MLTQRIRLEGHKARETNAIRGHLVAYRLGLVPH